MIQQRTVTGLQEALKPRLPQPPPSFSVQPAQQPLGSELQPSRLYSSRRDGDGHVAYTDFGKAKDAASANVEWKRLAHVQLVKDHHDVCNAIMVLAELHRLKSPAKRLLLFPQAWAAEKKAQKGDLSDPFLDSSRRLMRVAARRYGVELRPVSPVIKGASGQEEDDVYSLANALAFTDFDRILTIESPGLLIDTSPLDAVLAFTESAPFAMLHDTIDGDGVHSDDLLFLEPSGKLHTDVTKALASRDSYNDTLLSTLFPTPLLVDSSTPDSALIRSIGTLHTFSTEPDVFNATAYLSNVAYIRFSDPKLPGPEYDVPWADKVAARPKNKEAEWVWTKLYGQFAQKRMEVCGLDLEFWRP